MIGWLVGMVGASALFFLGWQFTDSGWLVVLYTALMVGLCIGIRWDNRRREREMLTRLERILAGEGTANVSDEGMSTTERRLLSHISALEVREGRLREGYENLTSLIADIAHQCKTPLSSILLTAENLGDKAGTILTTQTEKLRFLLDSLTRLAGLEGGLIRENLRLRERSVEELVCRVVENSFAAAEEKQILLHCHIPPSLSAQYDLYWTAEAVGNILDNAIKYSQPGREIRLEAVPYDLFVRLDITDQAGGIPEAEREKIWKRFYRGTNVAEQPGAGIGLYLTAAIVHAQGGRVLVTVAEGGSRFSVFLRRGEGNLTEV